ncbi:TAP-like protein-domain-containing protein, partial [Xylariales sp. PMI_506]
SSSLFDWHSIVPSPELEYHPCYEGLRCARLEVPLDWLNISNPKTVAIVIASLPATVEEDDQIDSFGGTVVLQPGGPGASGVQFIKALGRHFQRTLDGNKHYEILSFDPRGVMFTTPNLDCFTYFPPEVTGHSETPASSSAARPRAIGGLDGGPTPLRRHLLFVYSFGVLYADVDMDTDILRYLSTVSVARDISQDVVFDLNNNQHTITSEGDTESFPSELPKLQYYGISYGTVLGNTFVSMFPKRVGRLIIDGVVDVNKYVLRDWSAYMADTEKVVDNFFQECFDAGFNCPLVEPDDTVAGNIRKRVDDFIEALGINPLLYVRNGHVEIINANDVRRVIWSGLYIPVPGYEDMAKILSKALSGNYSLLWQTVGIPTEKSVTLGEFFNNLPVVCSNWNIRPKWRFEGPFTNLVTGTRPVDSTGKGQPAAPLLLLSSRLDPVTPLSNVYVMSEGHPDSTVVVQESASHSTLLAGFSPCLAQIIRDYMEYGTVPTTGTVCPADEKCRAWRSEECELWKTL